MTAYYNEHDAYAAAWLRNLIAEGLIAPGHVDERDIRDVRPDDVRGYTQCHWFAGIGVWSYALRLAGWPDDRPVWTGSCPCQPFSAAGRRGGVSDERHLWPAWFGLIRACRPATVFGEQVASAQVVGGTKASADPAWLDVVCSDLEGARYACGAADIPAASVGAPHIRQRLWFVAHAADCGQHGRRGSLAGDGRAAPRLEPQRLRDAGLMGDAECERLRGEGRGPNADSAGGVPGQDGQRQRLRSHIGSAGHAGVALGDTNHERCERSPAAGWEMASGRRDVSQRPSGLSGGLGGLADADPERCPEHPLLRQAEVGRDASAHPETPRGGEPSFWSGAEWIACRDGKARPIEPGTFPLVTGASFAVGSGGPFEGKSRAEMLRAYGNAINAEAAAAFITAADEALSSTTPAHHRGERTHDQRQPVIR